MNKSNIFVLLILVFQSCADTTGLRRSVFIEDRDAPGLPEYSEWGYNTFGAYFGMNIFSSEYANEPFRVLNVDGETTLEFNGRMNDGDLQAENFKLEIRLIDYSPQGFPEMVDLHATVVDLKKSTVVVEISDYDGSRAIEILNGVLQVKRAQYLILDDQPAQVILSGVFEFQALVDGNPIAVTNGRFDVAVSDYNFFKY